MLQAERRVLERSIAEVATAYGTVRVKYNEHGNFAPEYDDCRKAALAKGVPLRKVISEVNQAFAKQVNSNHS